MSVVVRKWRAIRGESALTRILLQKSKVASVRIFGETLKHEAIDDSDNLSRATEVACEFSVRDEVPQISPRKTRLRPSEFLTPSAKRLLQHYPPMNGHCLTGPTGPFRAHKRT
jgi:hypothetical protein